MLSQELWGKVAPAGQGDTTSAARLYQDMEDFRIHNETGILALLGQC